MNFQRGWITGIVALSLFAGTPRTVIAQGPPPPPGYQDQRPPEQWEMPPDEFSQIQRQGFRDGIEGARRDFDNHRRPDPNNRDEYRHPQVPREDRGVYREAFRRGYHVGVDHLMGEHHDHPY